MTFDHWKCTEPDYEDPERFYRTSEPEILTCPRCGEVWVNGHDRACKVAPMTQVEALNAALQLVEKALAAREGSDE